MPNRRGTGVEPGQLETAKPWPAGRFADAEPQDRRGHPGSRGMNDPVRQREQHSADEWCGVHPLPPILDSMPRLKTGDQGG